MKSRIFIGSSKEGLLVADYIKSFFSRDYDCYLWTDDVFKENDSFMETLLREASLFDFAFMVFSKDDLAEVRGELFETPRDNVLFEFGLFIGRVGVDRAFVIREKGSKIPSDLFGITQTEYSKKEDNSIDTVALENALARLKNIVDENDKRGHLSLLPSTVIAMSYYNNFIKVIADTLFHESDISIDNKLYKINKLIIKVPAALEREMKEYADIFYRDGNLSEMPIKTQYRSYPIHYRIEGESVFFYDVPTIMCGIYSAIDMYFHEGYVGKASERKMTEEREILNFKKVLQILIEGDAYCRRIVSIE